MVMIKSLFTCSHSDVTAILIFVLFCVWIVRPGGAVVITLEFDIIGTALETNSGFPVQ